MTSIEVKLAHSESTVWSLSIGCWSNEIYRTNLGGLCVLTLCVKDSFAWMAGAWGLKSAAFRNAKEWGSLITMRFYFASKFLIFNGNCTTSFKKGLIIHFTCLPTGILISRWTWMLSFLYNIITYSIYYLIFIYNIKLYTQI